MTGKQAEAQARVCVRTRSTLFTSNQGGLFFLLVPEGVVFIQSPAVSEGYIYVRHALLVVSGLALCEWGFNWDLPSSFLPRRAVFTLFGSRCVYSAFHAFTTRFLQGDRAFASKYGGI